MDGDLENYDFAEQLPSGLGRIDMPDDRTRLHVIAGHTPGDYKDLAPVDVHRIIDRGVGRVVLSLWRLDCESLAEWRDGALDLRVQPNDLRLRIDLARGSYRAGDEDAPWVPIDELQSYADREIGIGFGNWVEAERQEAEYDAGAGERADVEQARKRKENLELILIGLVFSAGFVVWLWL